MDCTCAFRFVINGRIGMAFPALSIETTFASGNEFKSTSLRVQYPQQEKMYWVVIDETLFEVVSGFIRLALGCQAKKEQIIARSISKEKNIVCCR